MYGGCKAKIYINDTTRYQIDQNLPNEMEMHSIYPVLTNPKGFKLNANDLSSNVNVVL